jgi:nitrous oxidase accessory protein NosD
MSHGRFHVAVGAACLAVGLSGPAFGATLCVRQGGGHGCFPTITAAVAAAAPNDTIEVEQGRYAEDVVINKPLSLVGAHRKNTIIDASGKANGVDIDGLHNPGLSHVVVTGFTIENANFEGILATNASQLTIYGNDVVNNNRALQFPACPGIPSFETSEDFDCGEGIHLSGVDHSRVADNLSKGNSGGILLSDDTGATHDNVVTGNAVLDNPFDCGITLASHPPAAGLGATAPFGVSHNTISFNDVERNGPQGEGAGVGIFDSVPGAKAFGNVVIGNRIVGNGIPGVALHAHAPNQNLNDNAIVANYIAKNGADQDDTATPGPTGINVSNGGGFTVITGTIVTDNVIKDEQIAVAYKTGAVADAHLNDFLHDQIGVANLGSPSVNATLNWWGCSRGPGAPGCAGVSGAVMFTPWLTQPVQPHKDDQ